MRVDVGLDAIQFNDAPPIFEWRGYVYHVDYTGRTRGQLYYTKFEKDMKTAIHSVQMPYTKTFTLGETIDRGEGLQKKLPPAITELPAIAYAVVKCEGPAVTITKNV